MGGVGLASEKTEGKSPDSVKSSEDSANKGASESSLGVKFTTSALFRAKNSYREEVRAEMMETQLDDRHDILGNTVYRLSFDASVLAGTRRDVLAGISVKLSHCPNRANLSDTDTCSSKGLTDDRLSATKRMYDEDYERLYYDWIRDLQKTVAKYRQPHRFNFICKSGSAISTIVYAVYRGKGMRGVFQQERRWF